MSTQHTEPTPHTYDVRVLESKRAGTSKDGNPNYVLHTDRGIFKTKPDSTAAYSIESDFPLDTPLDVTATLKTDFRGNIWDWEVTSK